MTRNTDNHGVEQFFTKLRTKTRTRSRQANSLELEIELDLHKVTAWN